MKVVCSDAHRGHQGAMELMFNRMVPMFDRPDRVDRILARMDDTGFGERREPEAFGLDEIHRVHDAGFVGFLSKAYDLWQKEVGDGGFATAYVFGMRGMKQKPGASVHSMLSCYTFDLCVPFVAGTWEAIKASADIALSAQKLVREGERAGFALCRPPGHHASQDLAGGYCYLNNAGIAAQAFLDQGAKRVAILDVDYHHGNGTQRIFYERSDVLYVSIHGRPEEEYPFLLGYADETGGGPGEGFNRNLPLPKGTDWGGYEPALRGALAAVAEFAPDAVVCSLGVDAHKDDPVSAFRLESDDFSRMGEMIASLPCPVLFVMEGGYAIGPLGINVVNLLASYEGKAAR